MPRYHFAHPNELFDPQLAETRICTGNEAFARGLFEANVQCLATYPGTPVSEIGDLWEFYAGDHADVVYDLSVNETIAFETAVGAAWAGVRAAVTFKHLGMNLISDALHSVMYSGIDGPRKAGLVIICGGDPAISSSTNAQDVRLFSLHSYLPILEPSSIQECKDFVLSAFELSEALGVPVMVYATNLLNHASGAVQCAPKTTLPKPVTERGFVKDFDKYLNAIHWARRHQRQLISLISKIAKTGLPGDGVISPSRWAGSEGARFTQVFGSPLGQAPTTSSVSIGFIGAGHGWACIEEMCSLIGQDPPRLKLNLTYPLVEAAILTFLDQFSLELIVIVEEKEPFLEQAITSILYRQGRLVPLVGKQYFSRIGHLSVSAIAAVLGHPFQLGGRQATIREFAVLGDQFEGTEPEMAVPMELPVREPTFCPGCSHRNVFYALRKASDLFSKQTGREAVFGGDIGCYTMAMSAPYNTMDWLVCMGAGVGIANGVALMGNPERQHLVALIGDSTFFHSGIPALINLVRRQLDVTVIILDNYYTAMTGHQISPSTPPQLVAQNHVGELTPLSIKALLGAVQVSQIQVFNGYSIRVMVTQFLNLFAQHGVKVALVKAECALQYSRRLRQINKVMPPQKQVVYSITENCTKCDECFQRLGCTAIQQRDDRYFIDNSRCIGDACGACAEICPNDSIVVTQIFKSSNLAQRPEEDNLE